MQWNLIKERKLKKETQGDVAKLLKISTETYRLKEKGTQQFKGDEMFLLADHFDKDISEIFLPTKYTKSIQKEIA